MEQVDLRDILLHRQHELAASLGTARAVIGHPGAKGTATESEWCRTFRGFLPARYEVGPAMVVDANGERSDLVDLVIFDRHHSPLLFQMEGARYVAAESVYAVFEVKQDLDAENVRYAIEKAESVRRLLRTSRSFVNAGVPVEARSLFRIVAGILATSSNWNPPFGKPLTQALGEAGTDGQLELGCALQHGAFEATYEGPGQVRLEVSRPEAGLMFLLLRLFEHLSQKGTVPAIDLREYGRSLEMSEQREQSRAQP